MSFFDCYLATKKYKNSRSRKFWGPFFLVAVYPQKIETILISSSYGMTMKTYIICFQFPTRNLFQSLGINRGQSSYSQMSSARGCEESPPKRIEFSFHEINSQKVIGWVEVFLPQILGQLRPSTVGFPKQLRWRRLAHEELGVGSVRFESISQTLSVWSIDLHLGSLEAWMYVNVSKYTDTWRV